jgi:hypothetical protein
MTSISLSPEVSMCIRLWAKRHQRYPLSMVPSMSQPHYEQAKRMDTTAHDICAIKTACLLKQLKTDGLNNIPDSLIKEWSTPTSYKHSLQSAQTLVARPKFQWRAILKWKVSIAVWDTLISSVESELCNTSFLLHNNVFVTQHSQVCINRLSRPSTIHTHWGWYFSWVCWAFLYLLTKQGDESTCSSTTGRQCICHNIK